MADDKFDPTTAKPVDATPDGFDPSSAYVPTIGGELKKGALRGIDTMQQGGYGLIAAAANAAGAKGVEDWAREGVARNAQEAKENPAAVGRIEDIGGVRDAALWASGGLAEQAAPMALSIAGAAVGAPGAGHVAKALGAAPGVIARAAETGAIVGAGATSIGQETGSIAADQIQDGNLQPGKALAYGVPAGLLDVIPESRLIRRITGHGKAIGVARDIATQAGLEGATETAQTALERKGNDKEVLSKEGISEMLNAAALGALGGGVVRAVSRPFDGAAAPAEPPAPEPVIAGLLPAPGQIPIQGGQGDFRTAEQIQAEIDAERNASEIYAARDAFEAARRPPPPPPPPPPNAGLLPAPGETVIPVPPAGTPGPNLDAEAADINAGAIQEARDAYEAQQAALRAGAQQPAPLALPAPGAPLGNIVLPNDAGPFSVTQTHIANDAQDHANTVEAAREAEIARLEASGPIGRAAAASMRTGAAQMAGAARAEEASGAPASPLALPEPLAEKDKRAQERVTKFAADLPAVTLAQAQEVARRATERYGEPVVVIPHPSGRGFTAVPQKVVSDGIRQQFDGIQREGGLPSPKPPESQLAVSPSGEVASQPVPDGMRSTMADWRRDMDTPTPKGAEPTGAAPPPIPPQLPIKKREAAVAKAEKLTAETGREHEVVPHPFMRNAFAVRPVANALQSSTSTEETPQSTQESDVFTGREQERMVNTPPAGNTIDGAAHEAATSLENDLPQPTRAQAEAGNYRKGHVKLHGLDISIENPAGSVRVGESEDGNSWASSMPHHYGYIRRSEGADGDHVDTFIGPNPQSEQVFVVNQNDPKTGKFDEHKVMLGFDSQAAAEAGYRAAYPQEWRGMGSVVATDVAGLKSWLKSGDTKSEFRSQNGLEPTQAGSAETRDLAPNALTHAPSVNVHVKASTHEGPMAPTGVTARIAADPSVTVKDRFDGRRVPQHFVAVYSKAIGAALKLGLPEASLDGVESFYVKRKDTGAEYAIEAQSIGISLDILEAAYRGSQKWSSALVGNIIHEVGHHISGDADGNSFVARSPDFAVRDGGGGKRQAVGSVMREALKEYNSGSELGQFLKYPLDNWADPNTDTIILQEEVFAQAWSLYFTNPDLLKSRMPATFNVIKGVADAVRNASGIAEARRGVLEALRRRSAGDGVGALHERGDRLENQEGTRDRRADSGMGAGRGDVASRGEARVERGRDEPAAEVRPAREEVASEDLRGDGRGFTAFFTDATTGGRKPNTGKRFEPVIDISRTAGFSREYEKHRGNFDDHIATSIPGFRETQQAVGNAIAKSLPNGGAVLDIGASEGSFIKAITALSGGKIKTVGLDPNVAMAKFFREHSSVPGSTYEMAAFGAHADEGAHAWDESDGTPIYYFKPKTKFDVVHEAMTFQFISDARDAQVARVKELMTPGGVALFEQKFTPPHDEFARNEAKKDSYKAQYYSAAELERKKKDVLERGEAAVAQEEKAKEEKVVGMHNLMVSPAAFEKTLGAHFAHVVQYWDSGNFKGYAASDNLLALRRLVANIGDLNSEYSTAETPRDVLRRPETLEAKVKLAALDKLTTPSRSGTLDAETPIKHAVRLETRTFKGRVGDRSHITRTDEGTIATSLIANLAGERGEKRGEHRNRIGEEWDQFKRDIAVNGINEPIFITVDPGVGARVSEGNHRLDAAIELGLSTVPVDIRYYGHAERDGLVHERAKRSGALDVKTPVVYRGEHGEDGRRPGRLEVRDEPTESGRKSSKVGAERGARVTGRRMLSGADALKIAGEGAKLGLSKKEIRALQDQARKDMSRFPPSDGWAKLEIVGVDRKPKTLSDGSVVYDAVVKYKAIPYKFNAPPGAERAPQNIDMAWAGRVAKVGVKEIVDLYERARAGDAVARAIVSHASWYRAMTSRLREEFGAAGDFYADLLGATSPNTPVDINWRFAVDIIKRFSRGELKEEMVAFEKWISEGKDISKFPAEQKIRQISGKLYGMNSGSAMVAIANLWRNIQPGTAPKARNFALNLIGQSNMATIDVWAARFLRRLANSIRGASFPRIPTVAEKGVTGKWNANATAVTGEFGFGAEVMKQMSEELARRGINLAPPDLQAVAWFLEKSVWTRNGWTSEQGEGGSFEVEADKAGLERFLAGWSIQRGNDRPTDHEVELEASRLLATVRSDEDVVSARAAPTIGMYDAETGERSFDTELTVRPGWSPWAFVSELARISRDRLQDTFFFSRALKPNEEHENARPGVEIYFKTERDLGRTVPLIRKLVESGQQGFTLTVDPRSERAGGVEASKFNGIRIQYVPEFEIRFGGPNAAALSSGNKKAVSDIIAAKREELEQIVQKVMNDDAGVALAKLFNYDTLVVAKEEYDVYAEAVAGGRAEESREALRPGQPIHEILADAARRYREGGEVGGADVPFGEAARPEGVTVEDPFEDAPKRPSKLEAKSAVAEPLWYSRLNAGLEKAPWSKAGDMPVGQLKMWLAARTKDGTLPSEEVKWSGLDDYVNMFASPGLKLTRDQVESYLAQNGVRVEEVELVLDDQARLIKAEDALIKYLVTTKEFTHIGAREYALDAARGDLSASQFEAIEDGEHVRLVQNLRSAYQDRNDRAGGGQTKYHEYQLPGGKNYRELLLTLPEAIGGEYGRFVRWARENGVSDNNRLRRAFDQKERLYHEWRRLSEPEQTENLGQIIDRVGTGIDRGGNFQSSHFDQPNILAHVRFNERRAADGSRVLFIEEIQSDWAQKGRKSGFVGKESDARKERDALMDEANNINRAPPTAERMAEIQRRLRELNDTGASVPTAPFVGKTESWVALALKRMIRYAADNGFDAVAWTNGEQQAERYDLSKKVDQIRYTSNDNGTFDVWASDRYGSSMSDEIEERGRNIKPEQIADIVGKEVAERIVRGEGREDDGDMVLEADQLKVGGEGMRAFYDKIVPNVANDLLKKLGGGRVGELRLSDPKDENHAYQFQMRKPDGTLHTEGGRVRYFSKADAERLKDYFGWVAEPRQSGLLQPGFRLTDDIKPKARRPQALFAKAELGARDVTETPEFKAWFGGSKVVDADGRPLVVYHGSERSGFSVFNESERGGFYFTNHIWGAQTYSGTKRAASIDDNVRAPGNYAVYLSLRDPMIVDFDGRGWDGSGPDGDVDPTVHMDEVVREAKDNGHDGVIALNINDEGRFGQGYGWGDVTYVAFRPEQIKSAIGNNGNFDPKRPSILESRAEILDRAQNLVADTLTTQRSFNLWDRTVGTQFHKSWKDPDFRKVYQGVQNYLNDASRLMMEAADLAPNVLPKLEGVRGILGVTASKADLEAMSSAIFDGTLQDVVYTDAQLAARGMSPEAIELYRETRSAIDRSLTDVFVSEAIKEAKGLLPADVLAQARERGDPWIVVDALSGIPVAQRSEVQQQVYDQLRERAARIEALKQAGYAPLMRFGRYTVHMTDANGGSLSFTMHESEREANAVARALRSEYPQHRVTQGVLSEDAWQLFQGISPDTLEIFAESVGASEKQLFQKYLKLATNNRSTLRRLIQRKKIPGFSPDAQRALAQFLTSNGRAASRNYHWGEVLKAANDVPKEKGDVKDEAVRLAQYVQHPSEEAGALRGLLFVQFLGGSVASALTNATQPVLMSFPYLSRFGAGKAAAALLGASKIAVGGVAPEADLRSAMARATEEGIIAPHEVAGLYAESIRNLGSNLVIRRILRAWGSLFSLAEAFNRRITFAAAFRLARDAGEADPYGFAVNAIAETQGVYNRGNRPNWARGAVGATIFTFKQYSIAYVEFLRRLPAKERAIAVAVLVLAAGIQGLPGADDLEDVVDTIAESLGYNVNSKKAAREWAIRTLGDTAGGLLSEGFSGLPGVPIDVQARLGLGNLIPGTGLLKRSNPDRSREVLEVFGPAGSQAKAFADAFGAAQEGNLAQIARSGLPLALQNAMKAVDMVSTGYYNDSRGRRVIDVDAYEAAIKGIGVQPKRVAEVQRRRQDLQQDVALQKDVEAEISDLWARGIFERDQEKVKRARAKLLDWNLANPESRIVIAPQQIQKRVQQASMTADQRFIKTAPPELRSRVAEELLR